jgi:hypothetical protein
VQHEALLEGLADGSKLSSQAPAKSSPFAPVPPPSQAWAAAEPHAFGGQI